MSRSQKSLEPLVERGAKLKSHEQQSAIEWSERKK
jgi:hypothetical protein